MKRLRDANLKLKRKKCSFGQTEIEFLGHILTEGEYKTSPRVTDAIRLFPAPNNKKETQRFVGMANYYRLFIEKIAWIAKSLTDLFRGKNATFEWTEDAQKAFEEIKRLLCLPDDQFRPRLAYPIRGKEFVVHTDASIIGLGAVLAQHDDKEKGTASNVCQPGTQRSRNTVHDYGIGSSRN